MITAVTLAVLMYKYGMGEGLKQECFSLALSLFSLL